MGKENAIVKREDLADQFSIVQHSQEEISALIEENFGGEEISARDLPKVEMPTSKGKHFTVPTIEGDNQVETLQGVIIHKQPHRAYWPEAYGEGEDEPQCFSRDGKNGIGDPGMECKKCPYSQWGSAPDGKGQACKDMTMLFLLSPGSFLPMLLNLPPTSKAVLKKFVTRLTNSFQPYYKVMVEISIETEKSGGGIDYPETRFRVVDKIDGEAGKWIEGYRADIKPLLEQTEYDYEAESSFSGDEESESADAGGGSSEEVEWPAEDGG